MIDAQKLHAHISRAWGSSIVPTLIEYIKIPNKSPLFDPDWERRGHMDAAVGLFENWARSHIKSIPGATVETLRLEGHTPLIFIDIPGAFDELTLLYGHLDKQPEMEGWNEGLGPWTPSLRGDKLYGRGGADDGYALFAALTAISALREQTRPHPRCVILIEACEESGSYDLPHYVDALADRLRDPSLVICLDAGCGDYDRIWLTTVNAGRKLHIFGA